MAKLKISKTRISFPVLWTPKSYKGDPNSKAAYSASFLVSKKDPQVKAIHALIEQVVSEKERDPKKAALILKSLRAQEKTFLHDGDLKEYDGYADHFYVSARSYTKPLVVNRTPYKTDEMGEKVPNTIGEDDGILYGGCIVNVNLDAYYDAKNGRVNASLLGVQFVEDGDAFGAGPSASPKDFDDLDSSDLT